MCEKNEGCAIEITVCIGSSCHIKGAGEIVEILAGLIEANHLGGRVILSGAFCMGECMRGVCVRCSGRLYSLCPEDAKDFFDTEVLGRLG